MTEDEGVRMDEEVVVVQGGEPPGLENAGRKDDARQKPQWIVEGEPLKMGPENEPHIGEGSRFPVFLPEDLQGRIVAEDETEPLQPFLNQYQNLLSRGNRPERRALSRRRNMPVRSVGNSGGSMTFSNGTVKAVFENIEGLYCFTSY